MKLFIEVNSNKLAKKILTILSLFQDEGIKVREIIDEVEEKSSDLTAEKEFRNGKETKLEVKERTEFLRFLHKVYEGRENISKLSDEEALEDALRDKYGL